MSDWIALLWALTTVLAFALGGWFVDRGYRGHWLKYRYCPACNRLDCAREHS